MGIERESQPVSRRGFVGGAAAAAGLLSAMGEEVFAARAEAQPSASPPAPVNCAVIGVGRQGRELLAGLARVPGANVVAVCDTYQPLLTRAKEAAPKAALVPDYRLLLSRTDVSAVFVATPSHKHKDIVLAALQAGKHVYCEAPLAHTIEDARAIAAAAKGSKQIFQSGLQSRTNPQHLHVHKFVKGGVLSKNSQARAQWHKKGSWRATAPTPAREQEMNWRLTRATSPGLMGEIGIHSVDVVSWMLGKLPVSVSGFSSLVQWTEDGRDVPDVVQCVFEYPGGVRLVYDASLANSFDGTYELIMGSDGTVLIRGQRAWMFKEVDAPLQGWEVYTKKEMIGDESGIVLLADASKILALGKIPGKDGTMLDPGKNAFYYAVESFLNSVRENKPAACGPLQGLQATVTALKANEAANSGTRIVYQKEWFDLS